MLPLLAVSSTAMAMASKVCVIVGLGNKGIGDACAMKWAKEGFKVAMLARRQETLDELEKSIPGSKAYRCDASQPTEVESTLQAITSDLGPIDVCIYNAGLGLFKRFEDTTFEEFETSWRCGPAGLFSVAKAVVPEMAARGGGVFGITGATASWRGVPMTPAFAAAKMGVRGLAQSLAKEYAPKNVHVFHCIIDGVVLQPRTKAWFPPEKPESEFLNPASIAQHYWDVAQQDKTCWTFESNVCPASRQFDMLTI